MPVQFGDAGQNGHQMFNSYDDEYGFDCEGEDDGAGGGYNNIKQNFAWISSSIHCTQEAKNQ